MNIYELWYLRRDRSGPRFKTLELSQEEQLELDLGLGEGVTPEMENLIDVPFREFVEVESDEIIHPTEATPGQEVEEDEEGQDDNQPDPEAEPPMTNVELLRSLRCFKEKAVKWKDERMMSLVTELELKFVEGFVKEENTKKQSSITDFFKKL